MDKLTVEAEVIAINEREGGAAIVFVSKRQKQPFAINLKGNDKLLKYGDRVIVEVSIKPKRKRAKKSEV